MEKIKNFTDYFRQFYKFMTRNMPIRCCISTSLMYEKAMKGHRPNQVLACQGWRPKKKFRSFILISGGRHEMGKNNMSHVVTKWDFWHMQTTKLQASLRIRTISPEALLFAWSFIKAYCIWRQTAKLLASLHGCAGSPEVLLFAYVRRPIFSWRGFIIIM